MSKTIADYQAEWTAADEAYNKATTEEAKAAAQAQKDAAHKGAEELRSTYGGYSGGDDGSTNTAADEVINNTIKANDAQAAANEEKYNTLQSQLNSLQEKVNNNTTTTQTTTSTYTPRSTEEYEADLDERVQAITDQLLAANAASRELSISEIEENLETGLKEYSQAEAEAYLAKLKNESNAVLRNHMEGDLGGTGNELYSSYDAAYDATLYQINLERITLQNTCARQIAELEAQGRYEDAQILSEWEQTKLSLLDEYEQNLGTYWQNQQSIDLTAQQAAFDQANEMLDKGFITADALVALGVSEDEAQEYADYINTLRLTSVENAKAEVANIQASTKYYLAQAGALGTGSTGTTTTGPFKVTHSDGSVSYVYADANNEVDGLTDGDVVNMYGTDYYVKNGEFYEKAEYDQLESQDTWTQTASQYVDPEYTNNDYSIENALEKKVLPTIQTERAAAKANLDSLKQSLLNSYSSEDIEKAKVEIYGTKYVNDETWYSQVQQYLLENNEAYQERKLQYDLLTQKESEVSALITEYKNTHKS